MNNELWECDMSSKALEDALCAVANSGQKEPDFNLGHPVSVHSDPTVWIVVGVFRAMWSEWFVVAVPENQLDAQPSTIPCSWLSDLLPGEKRYSNVVRLSDWRNRK